MRHKHAEKWKILPTFRINQHASSLRHFIKKSRAGNTKRILRHPGFYTNWNRLQTVKVKYKGGAREGSEFST